MAPSTALSTTKAVAILPTNVAPITTTSIVLSSPHLHNSCRLRRPQFCLLLVFVARHTSIPRCAPGAAGASLNFWRAWSEDGS
jgi:hypothetical protein